MLGPSMGWIGLGWVGTWMETWVRNICKDGRISDPAIPVQPDFCYLSKSGFGRILYLTPDWIFSISPVPEPVF